MAHIPVFVRHSVYKIMALTDTAHGNHAAYAKAENAHDPKIEYAAATQFWEDLTVSQLDEIIHLETDALQLQLVRARKS